MKIPDGRVTEGELVPPLQVPLLDDQGQAPDLTGATSVACKVKPANGCRLANVTLLDLAQDLIDARGGYVQHRWVAPETDIPGPGTLFVSFTVTKGGEIKTYPPEGWFEVRVNPKLA